MSNDKKIIISPYCYPGLKLNESEKSKIRSLPRTRLDKDTVLKIISEECQISISDIIDKTRKREIVDARHIFCVIARKYMKFTLTSIGNIIGSRDHTTISYSIKKFEDRVECEDVYRDKVRRIYEKLGIL